MSNIDINDLNSNAVPFFTRYLEGQTCHDLSEEEIEAISGGLPSIPIHLLTDKFPSDGDDRNPNFPIPLD